MLKRGPWAVESWRQYPAQQQPEYPDPVAYARVLQKIAGYPPLVFSGEIENLKQQIAEAGQGKRFILHGGDCAERFIDCNEQTISNQIKILLQMSVILTYGVRKSVLRIGRIAGQYAKPRTNATEIVDGTTIPSFRGDSVNAFEADPKLRTPDPERLLQSYYHAALTLNHIRAMIIGGFADLHHPFNWNLHSIEKTAKWPEYKQIVERILDAVNFIEAFGGLKSEALGQIDFFTSHEGLLLGYEEVLTRKDALSGKYYNLGAHMLWIGDRTRRVEGAHVEYFRGIANPIGIKIGPTCAGDELVDMLALLNPQNEAGRITLITRFGIEHVERLLPQIIQAVQRAQSNVTWSCDPMHGNMTLRAGSKKTRDFSAILGELKHCFRIHKELGTILAGTHFELTGEDVTECIGGAVELKDADLSRNYATYCDPRLNYAQSLEMAFLITQLLQKL